MAKQKVSKSERIRQAFAALGTGATGAEVAKFVKRKFRTEVGSSLISQVRGQYLRPTETPAATNELSFA